MLGSVDVLSFHDYAPVGAVGALVDELAAHGRPLVCSEYMARGAGSTLDPVLGYLQSERVWAIHWGLVAGRSQTIFPWDSWNRPYPAQPPLWHHDVLNATGAPYRAVEAAYLRNHTLAR